MGIYKAGKPFTLLQQGDTPDSYTKLLIHSDTSDGSTTFVDLSNGSHTITANGDAQHKIAQKKFGASSMYFDGTGDYLSIPDSSDWTFGTEDFTIDMWIYPTSVNVGGYNENWMGAGTNQYIAFGINSSGGMIFYTGAGSWVSTEAATSDVITNNNWQHVAVSRAGGIVYLFRNGVLITSRTQADSINPLNIEIARGGSSSDIYTGYIDEVRVSKGIARWTENFSPPSGPYPNFSTYNINSIGDDVSNHDIIFPSNPSEDPDDIAFGVSSNVGAPLLDVYAGGNVGVGVAGTPTNKFEVQTGEPSGSKFSVSSGNDSYTKLLIHSDDTDGNTTFIDSSANGHTITATNANHSTTRQKFGATSMHFDGTGQQLSIADSADFYYGTGDFTVDFWVYPETVNRRTTLYTQMESGTDSSQRIDIKDASGYKYRVWFNSASGQQSVSDQNIGSVVTGEWAHIAFVRNGDIFKGYLNGVEGFSVTSTAGHWDIGEPLLIMNSTDNLYANGIYMDEFRISKGIARWTSNFTPPIRQYGDALTVDGPKGKLYTVTDAVESHGSGSVFSVNTTGGLPALNVLDNGCVTKPYQPAFSVGMSAYQNNIAVGSSYIPIQFDTDSGGGNFNQGGHYNTSNYTFTAPVTGKYQFNAVVQIFNLDIDADYYEMLLETSNKVYDAVMIDPNAFDQDVPYWYFNMSILTAMDVGDTCILNIRQLGNSSTAQADITTNSVYSGYLVC